MIMKDFGAILNGWESLSLLGTAKYAVHLPLFFGREAMPHNLLDQLPKARQTRRRRDRNTGPRKDHETVLFKSRQQLFGKFQRSNLHASILSGWQNSDAVLADGRVPRDDRQPFNLSLGDQHAVERIFVMAGQGTGGERVPCRHR